VLFPSPDHRYYPLLFMWLSLPLKFRRLPLAYRIRFARSVTLISGYGVGKLTFRPAKKDISGGFWYWHILGRNIICLPHRRLQGWSNWQYISILFLWFFLILLFHCQKCQKCLFKSPGHDRRYSSELDCWIRSGHMRTIIIMRTVIDRTAPTTIL
jgi:hypothetical protein